MEPEVGKITIEDSSKAYDEAAKSHISRTPYGPHPEGDIKMPHTVPRTGEIPKLGKTNVINTKEVSHFLKNNQSKIALGALGVGIAKSFIDGDDDDILSSAGKGIKTAVVTSGLTYAAQHVLKNETVQDLVKGEISDVTKSMNKKADAQRKILTKGGKIGTAFRMGLMAAGAATVLDVGQRTGERLEAARMKQQQEMNLKEKKKKQQQKNKEKSYGYIDDGEILFDLFNSRSGHYKMGNAKFE